MSSPEQEDILLTPTLDPEFQKKFSARVEDHVAQYKDMSYMEAVLALCEIYGIEDYSAIKTFLSGDIKSQIEEEAEKLNIFKRDTGRLPV